MTSNPVGPIVARSVQQQRFTALEVTVVAGVATVTIDNPPLNLLDVALITDLRTFVEIVREDGDIRVVVLQSADPEFFSAHGDAHFATNPELLAPLAEGRDTRLNPIQALHESLRTLPQITIGKVAGYARGGGLELLMSLDMRFAAIGKARLGQPETLMGIIPGGGGTQYLTRLIGRPRALEVILGGELLDSELAERYGVVNRALPAEALDEFVDTLAARIAKLPPAVVRGARTAIAAALSLSYEVGLSVENAELAKLSTPEAVRRWAELLDRGLQTREGEKRLEEILNA